MKPRILIVDDEKDMLHLLKRSLEPELNCTVQTATSGESAWEMLSHQPFDLVLADIRMPGISGMELLKRIRKDYPALTVLMMTAYGCIDLAVQAMKFGAYDFITKPFDHDALVVRLEKALERSRLIHENIRLKNECPVSDLFHDLVGKSDAMQRVYDTVRMVAKTDLTVLITGESGTGKELTARAVHALSDRCQGPFVAVNCPSVPETILESELFGYKKGAFTHAAQNKTGLFQEAQHGSIFLDEIGDISPGIQTKLLRVLQEKEIRALGDTRSVRVDVRIIASTNQNLKEKIGNGQFREDFYYRLNVLPIHLPPLRERVSDIPLIAAHLLKKHCQKLNKPLKRLSSNLMELFMNRVWEGNVRQMENLIIQGILFSEKDEITADDLRFEKSRNPNPPAAESDLFTLSYKDAKEETLRRFNECYIGHALCASAGNVTHAAKLCGLERQALQQIMRRYGVRAEEYRGGTMNDI